MDELRNYSYAAADPSGRTLRGRLAAESEAAAFEALRAQGLSPLRLKASAAKRPRKAGKTQPMSDRETADTLKALAELLKAGADIRTALAILKEQAERERLALRLTAIARDIASGDGLEVAFSAAIAHRNRFVLSLMSVGQKTGDLPASLSRGAELINGRLKLRDELVSALAYPAFVFASAIVAIVAILLFVVPAIVPLAAETGGELSGAMAVLATASDGLRQHWQVLVTGLLAVLGLAWGLWRAKLLQMPIERLLLDGPMGRTVRGMVFGRYAHSLGTMLAAGAPMMEALLLSADSLGLGLAQKRTAEATNEIRGGKPVAAALRAIPGFPATIARLAAVGETGNTLAGILIDSGQLEEHRALVRISRAGQVLGPLLIAILGLMLGLLMAALLTGVNQLGDIN